MNHFQDICHYLDTECYTERSDDSGYIKVPLKKEDLLLLEDAFDEYFEELEDA